MSGIHTRPVVVSWDEASGCFIVSDFQRDFKPIMTEANLAKFIKDYAKHAPTDVRWHPFKGGANWSSGHIERREEELQAMEAWLAEHVVEGSTAREQRVKVKDRTFKADLDDLLGPVTLDKLLP